MPMKRLVTISIFWLGMLCAGYSQSCEIPPNYFQDPNFESTLSPAAWTGAFDWISWGAWQPYTNPEFWVTDTTETHSGTHCLVITEDSWIWPTVTTVGFEEKDMKMSFWYKSPIGKMGFWMFVYRDAKLTPEAIRPPLQADLVGADTAYITYTAGTTDEEAIYFEMGKSTDWKYFEFKFAYPGTIPGSSMTLMFWSQYTPGFIDDVYYGTDFDCVYNGEEETSSTGIVNGDFENDALGTEWFLGWDKNSDDYISTTENHTDGGEKSLMLYGGTKSTYYLSLQDAAGKETNFGFWYKGNSATLQINYYKTFNVGVDAFPLPQGAKVVPDSTEYGYNYDSIPIYDHNTILDLDTLGYYTELDQEKVGIDTFLIQDFSDQNTAPYPIDGFWSNAWYFWDWPSAMVADQYYTDSLSLWLPGDAGWSGVWGGSDAFKPFEDSKGYEWSFMYKGKLTFELFFERDLKYDLSKDPDKIIPPKATIVQSDGKDAGLHWDLQSDHWTKFVYTWKQGTWLADSSLASPATVGFNFGGTDRDGDNGWIDHLMIRKTKTTVTPDQDIYDTTGIAIDTTFAISGYNIDSVKTSDMSKVESSYTFYEITDTIGAYWNLPAATDWTQVAISWTNPSGDIGSTLPFYLWSDQIPGKGTADTTTYFDDFSYEIVTGINKHTVNSNTIQIYPNPVTDVLNIDARVALSRAVIYNLTGQQIRNLNNPRNQINVASLPRGVYILHLTDRDGNQYKAKFVRQ